MECWIFISQETFYFMVWTETALPRNLPTARSEMMDGVIELSLEYVETIAGVVRRSTQIAPR